MTYTATHIRGNQVTFHRPGKVEAGEAKDVYLTFSYPDARAASDAFFSDSVGQGKRVKAA